MEPSNRLHHAIHSFRQSARASFLFPNWLKKDTESNSQIKPAFWITFKWAYYRLVGLCTQKYLAQQYFLECLLLENKLLQLSQSQEQWQKNFIHRERQEQLDCFEKILNLHFKQTSASKKLHTFPEIILVMAQTLEESEPFASLHEEATKVISSYDNLRSFLKSQIYLWRLHKIELRDCL